MAIDKNNPEQSWISIILRIAMASMFGVAAYFKFSSFSAYSTMINGMLKDSFLPGWLLNPYIFILPFAEALICLWLLVGHKLREAWIFTALVLVSLAFGLTVAKQNCADNLLFVLIACVGLYVSRYDACCGPCCKKK